MIQFIDDHKNNYGVELICRVLPIAPSTYYRAKDLSDNPHKRSLRSQHDDYYLSEIKRKHPTIPLLRWHPEMR